VTPIDIPIDDAGLRLLGRQTQARRGRALVLLRPLDPAAE
jgi:hypothetical protein